MNRQLLDQHFAPEEIKQRVGGNGKTLDYVEGHVVIARLNDAFDGNWDFIVKSFEVSEARDEVLVVGKLTAEGITKMQFGSSSITRNKATKEPVSIGDDLKSAATAALKKCATLFGVGLHLYGEKNEARTQPGPSHDPVPAPSATTPAPTPGRITSKQHSYLQTLSRGHGLTRRELDSLCMDRFQVIFDHITRSEASLLIEEFNNPETAVPPQAQQQSGRRTAGGVQ